MTFYSLQQHNKIFPMEWNKSYSYLWLMYKEQTDPLRWTETKIVTIRNLKSSGLGGFLNLASLILAGQQCQLKYEAWLLLLFYVAVSLNCILLTRIIQTSPFSSFQGKMLAWCVCIRRKTGLHLIIKSLFYDETIHIQHELPGNNIKISHCFYS